MKGQIRINIPTGCEKESTEEKYKKPKKEAFKEKLFPRWGKAK